MSKLVGLMMIFAFGIQNLFAGTFYVNGKTGKDDNDGITKKTAFATINKAVGTALGNDEIVVEGRYKNDEIVYNETVILDNSKFGMKLTGVNSPVVDGDYDMSDSVLNISNGNAFTVNANLVSIKGFVIKNFKNEKEKISGIAGAAVYISPSTGKHVLEGLVIDDCNWGLYLDGVNFCEVNGNVFNDIEADSFSRGGSAIVINPGGQGIEENKIGTKKGNIINSADTYGICLGSKNKIFNADNTTIENNVIKECEKAGIAVFDIEGIVKIVNNVLKDNETSVYIGGIPIDTWIGQNVFEGASGDNEISTDSGYDGFLLYDIWKNNKNVFKDTTYAAVSSDPNKPQVIITKQGGFIRLDKDKAEEDAGSENKVMEMVPGK